MGQKGIEGTIKPVIVDLLTRNAKKIIQGGLVVPLTPDNRESVLGRHPP